MAIFNGFWVTTYFVAAAAAATTTKIIVNVKEKTKENKLDFLMVLNIVLVYPWSGNQLSKVWKENKSIFVIHSMYLRGLVIYPLPV